MRCYWVEDCDTITLLQKLLHGTIGEDRRRGVVKLKYCSIIFRLYVEHSNQIVSSSAITVLKF